MSSVKGRQRINCRWKTVRKHMCNSYCETREKISRPLPSPIRSVDAICRSPIYGFHPTKITIKSVLLPFQII